MMELEPKASYLLGKSAISYAMATVLYWLILKFQQTSCVYLMEHSYNSYFESFVW
jgi:hypothetical protein